MPLCISSVPLPNLFIYGDTLPHEPCFSWCHIGFVTGQRGPAECNKMSHGKEDVRLKKRGHTQQLESVTPKTHTQMDRIAGLVGTNSEQCIKALSYIPLLKPPKM